MPTSLVYNIDCMEFMKNIPDKFFDLAIVDPPYGIEISKRKKFGTVKNRITSYLKKDWDNSKPSKEFFDELFRVSKNQFVFGGNYFTEYLYSTNAWIFWDKGWGENFSYSAGELIWSSLDFNIKKVFISRKYTQNNISNNPKKAKHFAKIHQAQKPIEIYKYILENFAEPSWKIFDSHLGSGSSRIACYELGFDFLGCEIDKDYFEAMEKRFQNYLKQPKLFIKEEDYIFRANNKDDFHETNNLEPVLI